VCHPNYEEEEEEGRKIYISTILLEIWRSNSDS
jgi:hypothetical protein